MKGVSGMGLESLLHCSTFMRRGFHIFADKVDGGVSKKKEENCMACPTITRCKSASRCEIESLHIPCPRIGHRLSVPPGLECVPEALKSCFLFVCCTSAMVPLELAVRLVAPK